MCSTKRWNCVTAIGGKAGRISLREARRGIGNSIHLKLPLSRLSDCLASNRSKLLPIVTTALLALLAGCSGGVLDPQGPIGASNAKILFNALGIVLAIVGPTIIAVLVFAWWFRASNTRAHYLPDWVFSGRIELLSWGIPLLIIVFLGGVIWVGAHQLESPRKTNRLKCRSFRLIGNGYLSIRITVLQV
jgi:heme/copper-type cytochrome/quinol oxidase subunit 2